jgi:hypothetical protein
MSRKNRKNKAVVNKHNGTFHIKGKLQNTLPGDYALIL